MRTVLLLLLVSFAAGCSGPVEDVVEGEVVDSAGKPVAGAEVRLFPDDDLLGDTTGHRTVTDARGRFRVSIGHAPGADLRLRLVVNQTGYSGRAITFTSSDRRPLPPRIALDPPTSIYNCDY